MLSSSSPYSKRSDRPLRSNTPHDPKSLHDSPPELSDVQCYTCRRRHVKCDRILPHCAKCAKKGVACLGYQKPLRWADGVAVRGRYKGKTQPVIDSQAMRVSRDVFEESRTTVRAEAAHFGLHSLDSHFSDVTSSDATFLVLIRYHNTVMCAEQSGQGQIPITMRKLASVTPRIAQNLPRDFLNCVLGTAAVHMAGRDPGNRRIQKLALEAKVGLFEGINTAFQQPQQQRADVLFACTTLMFAMDIIEHGVGRWAIHFLGALKILASSAGIEHFASNFPHLRLQLATISQFETMHVVLSPLSIEHPRQASRNGLKTICFDSSVRQSFFITSPLPLLRAVYDMAVCARNIFHGQGAPSAAEFYTREWILSDAIRFEPDEGVQDIQQTYFKSRDMTTAEVQAWSLVMSAWRGSMTIVILRYLFFGLPEPDISSQISRTPTPTPTAQEVAHFTTHDMSDDTTATHHYGDNIESYIDSEHLSPPEAYLNDPFSPSPSPLPSPRPTDASITFDHWQRRYDIHNGATAELFHSLSALSTYESISHLRYALIPLMVLALTSRPNSDERSLCVGLFERFKASMAHRSASSSNPIGGSALDFNIPWEKLDAFSAEAERQGSDNVVLMESQLRNTAPEWNWWYMLKRVNLETVWPVQAGAMHIELGTEFWAFNVLSACCTDECFAAFMQAPTSISEASSAS